MTPLFRNRFCRRSCPHDHRARYSGAGTDDSWGYSFFTPYLYPNYPGGAYPSVPAPIQSQNTPINTCDGGGCSYSAVASYGACYTGSGGQALRNVTTWECCRYDGVVASPSLCEPPASPVPCNN